MGWGFPNHSHAVAEKRLVLRDDNVSSMLRENKLKTFDRNHRSALTFVSVSNVWCLWTRCVIEQAYLAAVRVTLPTHDKPFMCHEHFSLRKLPHSARFIGGEPLKKNPHRLLSVNNQGKPPAHLSAPTTTPLSLLCVWQIHTLPKVSNPAPFSSNHLPPSLPRSHLWSNPLTNGRFFLRGSVRSIILCSSNESTHFRDSKKWGAGGRCVLVSVAVLIQKIEGYGSCVGVCEMCTRKGNSEITRKPAVWWFAILLIIMWSAEIFCFPVLSVQLYCNTKVLGGSRRFR